VSANRASLQKALFAAGGAAAVALVVAGTSGAAGKPVPTGGAVAFKTGPVAALRPAHRRVVVGKRLLLDASRSTDPGARIVKYLWDLNGDGVFERNTGSRPRVRHAFRKPGRVRVAVALIDDKGDRAVGRAKVRVVAAARPKAHRHTKRKPAAAPATTIHAAASSGSVTIKNFAFSPKSISINVGDTVTWTNEDPVRHNAISDAGVWDSGTLNKGNSFSKRFTTAGTYKYTCTFHPTTMHGTVIVKGSNGSGGSSSGSNNSSSNNTSSSKKSSSSSSLPHTGLPLGGVLFAGYLLLATGAALRRRVLG
jgi:plastocyanin